MATSDQISQLAGDIARHFNPEKIILFGSYAYGLPTSGSDVDLLVVMSFDGNPLDKMVDIVHAVHPRVDVDLLVRTPQMIEKRLQMGDTFVQEIISKGKLLYERANA